MSETNNAPSLEELVYYMDGDTNDDLNQPLTPPSLGVDPTEDDLKTDSKDDNDDDDPIEDDNNPFGDEPEEDDSEDEDEPDPISAPKPEKSEPEEESENDESSSIYDQFYSVLTSEGILSAPDDFEFDGTPESLQEVLDHTKQQLTTSVAQALWERLPEDFRSILDYGLSGGTDLNTLLKSRQELTLDNVDLDNTSHQREVMRKYFKETTKYDEDRIERMIDKLDTVGTLQEDAAEALDDLKEIISQREKELVEQKKLEREQALQQAQEIRQQIFDIVDNTEYLPPQRKNKVKAFMFNPITRNKVSDTDFNRVLQSVYSNPEHLIQLADLMYDYDPKKGLNLERFQKASKSSAARKLKEKLESIEDVKSKVSGKGSKVTQSTFDWEEFLKQN